MDSDAPGGTANATVVPDFYRTDFPLAAVPRRPITLAVMIKFTPVNAGLSVLSGLAGAAVLTAVHESARHVVAHAPRTDVLGSRAIAAGYRSVGLTPPRGWTLYALAIAADVLSNAAIYAIVPLGENRTVYRRGAVVGFLTGLTALVLPPLIGLGRMPGRKTPNTQVMTFAWYTAGGVAAAWAWRRLRR